MDLQAALALAALQSDQPDADQAEDLQESPRHAAGDRPQAPGGRGTLARGAGRARSGDSRTSSAYASRHQVRAAAGYRFGRRAAGQRAHMLGPPAPACV
jgi:hypothetical protein